MSTKNIAKERAEEAQNLILGMVENVQYYKLLETAPHLKDLESTKVEKDMLQKEISDQLKDFNTLCTLIKTFVKECVKDAH